MKIEMPAKPDKQKDQIDMMWVALYNHTPHRFRWMDIKMNFLIGLHGLQLALIAIVIALIATAL